MIHEILPVGVLQCNCSILGDETTGEAMVVDPGDEPDRILAAIEDRGLTVRSIVITHAHIDHVMGVAEVRRRTGAAVAMHPGERALYDNLAPQAAWLGVPTPERVEIDTWLKAGDTLRVGEIEMEVRFTPGHSPASISLWIPSAKKAIVADTLFRRSIGRTDLPGADHATLVRSIRDQLFTLPPETVVVPGHGDLTTIGEEIRWNPFFA
jgi:hydroxyacylglutathione hydrolase